MSKLRSIPAMALLIILLSTIYGINYAIGAYISTGVAKAVCKSLSSDNAAKKIVSQKDFEKPDSTYPSDWMRWTKCDNTAKHCSRFVFEIIPQSDANHRPGRIESTDSMPKQEITDKLKIIITLKAELNCSEDEIPRSSKNPKQAGLDYSIGIQTKMIALQQEAQNSQKGVMDLLEKEYCNKSVTRHACTNIDSLWITNEIVVTGVNLADVQKMLDGNADVQSVREEYVFTFDDPIEDDLLQAQDYDEIINRHWGVAEINAPQVWEAGYNGSGITVACKSYSTSTVVSISRFFDMYIGIIDSGVDASHEILMDNYRKDYGWFDPQDFTETPRWSINHGTHVAGSAVGRKGIGVAPGAQFIACLACPSARCPEVIIKKCAQWMYCPTDTNGKNPDCSKRPHVINMSIGGLHEGETENTRIFAGLVDCWRHAGVFPVFSIGNRGPSCNTLGFAGVLPTVIGVGNVQRLVSTDANPVPPVEGHFFRCDHSSSRGPPRPPYNGTIKPDVSAPGTAIVSSIPANKYIAYTGTSMASPHVAGTAALMLQKNPNLSYDEIKSILISTAIHTSVPAADNPDCGGIPGTTFPNHSVGYGVINAYKAINKVKSSHACKHKFLV